MTIPGLRYMPPIGSSGGGGGGGGGSGLSLSFYGYSTSGTSSISMPSGTNIGDWAILFDCGVDAGSTIPTSVPSGWATLANEQLTGGVNYRMTVSHRILTSTGSITGMNPGNARPKILLVFRPSTSIISTVASTWNSQVTASNPTLQSVTASGVTTPLVVFAFAMLAGTSVPTFSTETPSMTNVTRQLSSGTTACIRVGYTVYNSSPSNQSVDLDDAGTQGLQSGYVRFT